MQYSAVEDWQKKKIAIHFALQSIYLVLYVISWKNNWQDRARPSCEGLVVLHLQIGFIIVRWNLFYFSDTYLQNSMLHTNYILLKIKTFGFVLEFEMWSCGMNQTWHDICYIYFGGMYSLALMMSISTRTTCKNIDKINESFKTEFTRFTDYLNTFLRNNS